MWTDERGSELLPFGDCARLLATAAKKGLTGRLGISTPQAPAVQPVNFAFVDHRIVVRLGPGRLVDLMAGAVVAFEVDHVDPESRQAWSVLVRGTAELLSDDERQAFARADPKPLVPRPGDMIFTVSLDVVTGRRFKLDKISPDSGVDARRPSMAADG